MDRNEFLYHLQNEPIINSHSHHLRDEEHHALTMGGVFRNSYVNWCGVSVPAGGSKGEISAWLDAVSNRGYFVWLEKALMEIYGIKERLSAASWGVYDEAISSANQDKDWHIRLLREKCRYEAVILDTYWSPGEDNGHPELFRPAYRFNSFFYGYDQTAKDHNGDNIQVMRRCNITDIDEYTEFLKQVMREQKQKGCVTFKCALAYDRALDFGEAVKERAQCAMRGNADADDIKSFQDYVFDVVCVTAAQLKMPVQIHTGLGLMNGTNAMRLQPLIARHPDTVFWLMHGSYPWTDDIAGLTHAYSNVWADLCWLPLISYAASRRLIAELIDVCGAGRVVWGCDTWTSEESCGAKLAFLDVLSRVLCERVEAGLMDADDARRYAKAVMHDNAEGIISGIKLI